jgi:glutathione S-transferase
MAEKGIQCDRVQVNLAEKEQLTDDFRKLNPFCEVPVLELDDGTCICERFGIADITLFVRIDFAQRIKVKIGEDQTHLQR